MKDRACRAAFSANVKRLLIVLIIVISVFSLTACSAEKDAFVFGTFLEMTVKGGATPSADADKIEEYISSLEPVMSATAEGSDIYKINRAAEGESVTCHAETMAVLAVCEKVFDLSGGAFDPSVYPLVRLWKFSGDTFTAFDKAPPADAEIAELLTLVGFDKAFTIDYENNTVTKNEGYGGAMLDLGGSAKGYAADKARDLLKSGQKMLLNLGGNISAFGKDYTIGIGNPRESSTAYYGSFTLKSGECISTSGDYERCYFYEGTRYHHVINPSTGKPSASGLISVSVISNDGALGDAVSTAVLVLGAEKGSALINELGLKAVLIDADLNYTVVGDLDFVKK